MRSSRNPAIATFMRSVRPTSPLKISMRGRRNASLAAWTRPGSTVNAARTPAACAA